MFKNIFSKKPKILKQWSINKNNEVYQLIIYNNKTVALTYGKYAHGSGCKIMTWQEVLDGKMDENINNIFAPTIIFELKKHLSTIIIC